MVMMSGNLREINNWCNTKVQNVKFTYEWIIDNFTELNISTSSNPQEYKDVIAIESSHFPDSPIKHMEWQMKLCPNWRQNNKHHEGWGHQGCVTQRSNDSILMYMIMLDCNMDTNCTFNIKLSIKDMKGEQVNERKAMMKYLKEEKFPKKGCIPNFTTLSELKANNCLHNDQLTILCEISWLNIINITPKCNPMNVPSLATKLSDLYMKQTLSDVVFAVDGKEFKAHKAVLAMQSDVFERMFETNMIESQNNKVVIDDTEADIFEKMLKFIYTNAAEDLDSVADKLIYVAEKYNLTDLKFLCESSLIKNINAENSADLYDLAYLNNSDFLKENIIQFISTDPKTILNMDNWKEFEKNKPAVMNDVYRSFTLGTQSKRGRLQ